VGYISQNEVLFYPENRHVGQIATAGKRVTYPWARNAAERTEEDRIQQRPEEDSEGIVDAQNSRHSGHMALGAIVVWEQLDDKQGLGYCSQCEVRETQELRYNSHVEEDAVMVI
jgi:hypothetical protein